MTSRSGVNAGFLAAQNALRSGSTIARPSTLSYKEATVGQRVEYEALQGTRYDQYLSKLQLILGFLGTPDGTKFKPFRDFLRKNGLWDKEKTPTALSLIDLSWDRKKVKVGSLAKQMSSIHSLPELQELLYQRLVDANILLVKYVLEALDVNAGGRLHSVHELYRMVTSYVYPGDYVTLPNFQAWLDWLAATGYIKLVGIRWALSDKGQRVASELGQLDVEEILEDLEEEEESSEEESSEDDVAPGAPAPAPAPMPAPSPMPPPAAAPPPPSPVPVPSPTPAAVADEDEEEEDWADMPPEPEPPDPDAMAAASAAFESSFADVDEEEEEDPDKPRALSVMEAAALREAEERGEDVSNMPRIRPPRAAPPATTLAPMPAPAGGTASPVAGPALHAPLPIAFGQVVPPAVLATSVEASAIAERIIGWWNELGDWPVYTAPDLGVEVDGVAKDDLLIELGILATLIEGRRPQPQVFAFVQRMRDNGFFDKVIRGTQFGVALSALGDLGSEPWTRPLIERLVFVPDLVRRVQASPGVLERVTGAGNGRAAAKLLREQLFSEVWVEAPFWTLRELVRLGVAKGNDMASCAVVPTPRLLKNAARIGLVSSAELSGFDQLLDASESVATLFGARAGYGEALEVMDRALGLGP